MGRNALYSAHTVAYYLHSLKEDLSPVKLHKSLYFLFAYYGATLGKEDNTLLFDEQIEAWKYGPVVRDVFNQHRYDKGYNDENSLNSAVSMIEENNKVQEFIKELFRQIDECSDFSLIERSHQDIVFQSTKNQDNKVMDIEKIIKEYIERYID